jgi:hypothetical protein
MAYSYILGETWWENVFSVTMWRLAVVTLHEDSLINLGLC